jgi:hypothetical protein
MRKKMMKITTTTILFLIIMLTNQLSFSADNKPCPKLERLEPVAKAIKEHEKKIRGVHYCESTRVMEADIDGDGTNDLVVSYSIEGPCYNDKRVRPGLCGNYHAEFLSVFIKKDGKYKKPAVIQVGGRGERGVEDVKFEGNKIILKTLEYHEDPMCCPSKEGTATLVFENGKLTEVK